MDKVRGEPKAKRKRTAGSPAQFPRLLYNMLCNAEAGGYANVVSWLPHGEAFIIYDRDKFVEDVLPQYFNQSKFSSFQRQLNLYGFDRMENKASGHGSYYHPLFVRGKPEVSGSLTRQKGPKAKEQTAARPWRATAPQLTFTGNPMQHPSLSMSAQPRPFRHTTMAQIPDPTPFHPQHRQQQFSHSGMPYSAMQVPPAWHSQANLPPTSYATNRQAPMQRSAPPAPHLPPHMMAPVAPPIPWPPPSNLSSLVDPIDLHPYPAVPPLDGGKIDSVFDDDEVDDDTKPIRYIPEEWGDK